MLFDLLPLRDTTVEKLSSTTTLSIAVGRKTQVKIETNLRLFGVAIGAKGMREVETTPKDRDLQLQLGGTVLGGV